MAASTRISLFASRAVASAQLTLPQQQHQQPILSFSRLLSYSSPAHYSSWPVGANDDDPIYTPPPSSSSASSSSSSSSSSSQPGQHHRTRAGPILERIPPLPQPPGNIDTIPTTQALHQHPDEAVAHVRTDRKPMHTLEQEAQAAARQELHSLKSAAAVAPRKLPPAPRQKTIMYLDKMKEARTPIAALTAYDYPTALAIRAADIDICLVGDSLANVALGFATTQGLRLDALIHHAQAVQRALRASTLLATAPPIPLVVADMPFGTFQTSLEQGVRAAVSLIQDGGVDAVKIEGGHEVVPLVQRLTSFGIPVMGHVGLQPQRVGATSGYRVQGRSASAAQAIWNSAKAIQDAGAFSIVLECVPSPLARVLTERLHIPTIGIGAGPGCDGQILVTSDMLGELTSPAHVVAGLEGDHSGGEEEKQRFEVVVHAQVDPPPPSSSSSSPSSSSSSSISPEAAQEGIVPGTGTAAATKTAPEDEPLPEAQPAPSSSPALQQQFKPLPFPHPSTPTPPKFVRGFVGSGTTLGAIRMQAVRDYVSAVRERSFPAEGKETYGMRDEQLRAFLDSI
ncbi:cell wall biogenesis and architecture protein [Tilletia horrida]|uniref:3-methyl-2-oxobutanoate hydroxymethyltransferase n=1 Tax=Tilletia horrida TaxID=155126 RepID=A0AAN6JS21_9BASI|nr:cell wall biogenesis and architecture protein [Tilletia horrida]KAK0566204.1 cell wall biogenesis and architecture protein [Tilletia horrida]